MCSFACLLGFFLRAAGQRRDMSIFEFVEMLQLCGIVPHHVHENDVRFADSLVTSIPH